MEFADEEASALAVCGKKIHLAIQEVSVGAEEGEWSRGTRLEERGKKSVGFIKGAARAETRTDA